MAVAVRLRDWTFVMTDTVSPTESDPRDAILAEARRLAVDALYSEKGHFEAASAWRARTYWLGIPAALIGATAGATILADMDPAIGGSLALVGAAITALMTFLNPSERASQHHRSGVSYGVLRRALRQFVQIDVGMMDIAGLIASNSFSKTAAASRNVFSPGRFGALRSGMTTGLSGAAGSRPDLRRRSSATRSRYQSRANSRAKATFVSFVDCR